METIIICAFIGALLPYLTKAPLAFAMSKQGRYDNRYPREQQASLTGFGARALAAHQNAFESLIIFSAAVAVVLATDSSNQTMEILAISHIIARIGYSLMYYLNLDKLRSLIWLVGLGCPLAMIWLSLP